MSFRLEQTDGPLRVTQGDAWMGGIDFSPHELNELCVKVRAGLEGRSGGSTPTPIYTFNIVQRNGTQIIGGERYKVDMNKVPKESNPLEKLVLVFPNPASTFLKMSASDLDEREITLTDGLWRTLYETRFRQHLNLDITPYASGLYFVKIVNRKTNAIQVEKIVIK